jgi:RNA polymerase sigma factor (sigma-70 family)
MTEREFRAAFNEHKDAIYRFAWRMTSSPPAAEDIAQDVFLSLLRQPDRFDRARGALRSFLFGAARNLALKRWRDEHRWEALEDDADFSAPPPDPAAGETAQMVGAAVQAAVQALVPLQREALILAEYEGCSLEEIARAVDADVGTVKSRLHRARENLRRMLAPLKESMKESRTSYGTAK